MPKNKSKNKPKSKSSNNRTHVENQAAFSWVGTEHVPRTMLNNDVKYTFVQDAAGTQITQIANSIFYGAFSFRLSYLDQGASFSAIFDRFRITEVQMTFRPLANATNILAPSTTIIPNLITVVDKDDGSTPTSLAQLREYNNAVPTIHETQVRTFRPGTIIGNAVSETAWIDMANYNTADYYGVKVAIEAGAVAQTSLQAWSVTSRYTFECKHVR